MATRLWLATVPSSDPAFAPLQRAEELCDPAEWSALWQAHQQAVLDATWGRPLEAMDERAGQLRAAASSRADELEALGYALGVTAVRVATRERTETPGAVAA